MEEHFKDKMKVKKQILDLIARSRLFCSLCFFLYQNYQVVRYKECKEKKIVTVPAWTAQEKPQKKKLSEFVIAAVCDEMTYQNLTRECKVLALTPANWKELLCKERPDVFFCESAWTGLKNQHSCWHGRIYRNEKLLFENRKTLLSILSFCKTYQIPTVFWNKEDPVYFGNPRYNFTETALLFDWVFTTAKECVQHYQSLGKKQVDVLPFSFSPNLFHPEGSIPKQRKAVFAGSWYAEEKERCQAMERIFDVVLEHKIPLIIYDRQSGNRHKDRSYPEKYLPYVRPAVSFEQLSKVMKQAEFAININTVTDSETMFARRVYELMAMNITVITNESLGLRKEFPDGVWYAEIKEKESAFWDSSKNSKQIEEFRLRNLEHVFLNHTTKKRLEELLIKLELLPELPSVRIAVAVLKADKQEQRHEWSTFKQKYLKQSENLCVKQDGIIIQFFEAIQLEQEKTDDANMIQADYGVMWDAKTTLPEFKQMLPHFEYLPTDCGIRRTGQPGFSIVEDQENQNVLFPLQIFLKLLKQQEQKTKKYVL